MIRRPLPSPRSLVVRFPWLFGTSNRSDFLPLFTSGFFLTLSYRSALASSLPCRSERHPTWTRGLFSRVSPIRTLQAETIGSPRFLKDPNACMPCSPTPAGIWYIVASYQIVAFRLWNSVDSRLVLFRGSITRPADSLCTLRRMSCPTTTQHLVPAADTLSRAGLVTCRVPTKGFQSYCFLSPFSGFAWRTPN